MDCYELAAERGITVAQAALDMCTEGWKFVEYNDCGESLYQEPQVRNIASEAIGYCAHQEIIDAVKFANPDAKVAANEFGGITITL